MTTRDAFEDEPPFPEWETDEEVEREREPGTIGDFRGPYGYGRRAHGSDPEASYVFRPANRALRRRHPR